MKLIYIHIYLEENVVKCRILDAVEEKKHVRWCMIDDTYFSSGQYNPKFADKFWISKNFSKFGQLVEFEIICRELPLLFISCTRDVFRHSSLIRSHFSCFTQSMTVSFIILLSREKKLYILFYIYCIRYQRM